MAVLAFAFTYIGFSAALMLVIARMCAIGARHDEQVERVIREAQHASHDAGDDDADWLGAWPDALFRPHTPGDN